METEQLEREECARLHRGQGVILIHIRHQPSGLGVHLCLSTFWPAAHTQAPSSKRTCKWTPGFPWAPLDPDSYTGILAEQICTTSRVNYITGKWETDDLIFTKQPPFLANCVQLIAVGFTSLVSWLHVSLAAPSCSRDLGLRFFSDLIRSLCLERTCPACIVNKLPTETFNLLCRS